MSNLPPSVPTISSTTASPMPEPRTEFFALKNFCLTFSRSSGAMPRPWSPMDALTVTGVRRMLRCDPDSAAMETTKGTLTLAGAQLSVTSLDLDKGEVKLTGRVDVLEYTAQRTAGGFLHRLFH